MPTKDVQEQIVTAIEEFQERLNLTRAELLDKWQALDSIALSAITAERLAEAFPASAESNG